MRRVIIESPFAGDIPRNLAYARRAIRDSILRGESPYASHLIIPGALSDHIASERNLGIRCGYAWWGAASLIAFYTDLGWSRGMNAALVRAISLDIKWEERSLEDNPHRRDEKP